MRLVGLETENHSAGEGQKQFNELDWKRVIAADVTAAQKNWPVSSSERSNTCMPKTLQKYLS
jgi:hypothetical protein